MNMIISFWIKTFKDYQPITYRRERNQQTGLEIERGTRDTLKRPFDTNTNEIYVTVLPVVQEPKTVIIHVAISQSEAFSTALIF